VCRIIWRKGINIQHLALKNNNKETHQSSWMWDADGVQLAQDTVQWRTRGKTKAWWETTARMIWHSMRAVVKCILSTLCVDRAWSGGRLLWTRSWSFLARKREGHSLRQACQPCIWCGQLWQNLVCMRATRNSIQKVNKYHSFIHSAVSLTTGPKPLPRPVLQRMPSGASSFNFRYPPISLTHWGRSGSFKLFNP